MRPILLLVPAALMLGAAAWLQRRFTGAADAPAGSFSEVEIWTDPSSAKGNASDPVRIFAGANLTLATAGRATVHLRALDEAGRIVAEHAEGPYMLHPGETVRVRFSRDEDPCARGALRVEMTAKGAAGEVIDVATTPTALLECGPPEPADEALRIVRFALAPGSVRGSPIGAPPVAVASVRFSCLPRASGPARWTVRLLDAEGGSIGSERSGEWGSLPRDAATFQDALVPFDLGDRAGLLQLRAVVTVTEGGATRSQSSGRLQIAGPPRL